MKVTVNGKLEEIIPGTTILAYLEQRGVNPKMVIVEHNYILPPRHEWEKIMMSENDNLEVVKIIGGG
jgi:thiamine biosynthesis protein ThiS